MTFARIVLIATALVTFGFGVFAFARPEALAALAGLKPETAAGLTEVRAFYGGVELGLAAFWFGAALSRSLVRAALLSSFSVWSLVAAARTAGMVLDDSASPFVVLALASEVLAFAVALLALWRLPRDDAPAPG